MNDWNQKIIDEFRANGGKVGGPFENTPLVLVTHIGAKSGKQRVSPLAYLGEGDRVYVFASKGGAPTNPDWYYNLKVHPNVSIEIGSETRSVRATEITGLERDAVYARQVAKVPGFGDYEHKTGRVIPVVALDPIA